MNGFIRLQTTARATSTVTSSTMTSVGAGGSTERDPSAVDLTVSSTSGDPSGNGPSGVPSDGGAPLALVKNEASADRVTRKRAADFFYLDVSKKNKSDSGSTSSSGPSGAETSNDVTELRQYHAQLYEQSLCDSDVYTDNNQGEMAANQQNEIPAHVQQVAMPTPNQLLLMPAHSQQTEMPISNQQLVMPAHSQQAEMPNPNQQVLVRAHNPQLEMPAHDRQVKEPEPAVRQAAPDFIPQSMQASFVVSYQDLMSSLYTSPLSLPMPDPPQATPPVLMTPASPPPSAMYTGVRPVHHPYPQGPRMDAVDNNDPNSRAQILFYEDINNFPQH